MRAGAHVRFMRANNVYIIHHSTLTDADPFIGGLFGRTCVQRQRTQSDQAKRRLVRGQGWNRTTLFCSLARHAWIIILGYRMQQSMHAPSHRTHIAQFDANP